MKAGSSFASLRLEGHLFDKNVINSVLDIVESSQASCKVANVTVGADATTPTSCTLQLFAPTAGSLASLVNSIKLACLPHNVVLSAADTSSDGNSSTVVRLLTTSTLRATRNVLLLGAGMVTPPLVAYLLRRPANSVTVASMILDEALDLAAGRRRVRPVQLNVKADADKLESLVADADVVISLVPAPFHPIVVKAAIKHSVHVVTASYISDAMKELHAPAVEADITVLNECGLDPGMDHMSAMRLIDSVKARGGKVTSFSSLCGGLPAPEAANNPFGYKFSWSPRGVLTAASNPSKYRKDGAVVDVPGDSLLRNAVPTRVNPAFALEVLPNRNSLPYMDQYAIPDVDTMFRGTLRYEGFSELFAGFADLGFLSQAAEGLLAADAPPLTKLAYLAALAGADASAGAATVLDAAVCRLVVGLGCW